MRIQSGTRLALSMKGFAGSPRCKCGGLATNYDRDAASPYTCTAHSVGCRAVTRQKHTSSGRPRRSGVPMTVNAARLRLSKV
jgi:hypothetical protein